MSLVGFGFGFGFWIFCILASLSFYTVEPTGVC